MRATTMQFGEAGPSTLLAQRQLPAPIAFTRLRSTEMDVDPAHDTMPHAAFAILVNMAPMGTGASPGDTLVIDLRTEPVARLAGPYDFVRFYLPATTLDRLADDGGFPRVGGLRTTPAGVHDPVMKGLAFSLLPALEAPRWASSRFLDSIGLAFHAHVIGCYGCTPAAGSKVGSSLASWQLRRVQAFVDAQLEDPIQVADLARECRLSASQFTRRFSTSTGLSPHQWLTSRRIEHAKGLLLADQELSQIALASGFADQSHLNRAFTRLEGTSPGRWRREHRNAVVQAVRRTPASSASTPAIATMNAARNATRKSPVAPTS